MFICCATVLSFLTIDQVHQNAREAISVLKPIVTVIIDALKAYYVELVRASSASSHLQVMSALLAELCPFQRVCAVFAVEAVVLEANQSLDDEMLACDLLIAD